MRFLTLLFVILLAASCSIQKRHYRPGFFVQRNEPLKNAAQAKQQPAAGGSVQTAVAENTKQGDKKQTVAMRSLAATAEPQTKNFSPAQRRYSNAPAQTLKQNQHRVTLQRQTLPDDNKLAAMKRRARIETLVGLGVVVVGLLLVLFGLDIGFRAFAIGMLMLFGGGIFLMISLLHLLKVKSAIKKGENATGPVYKPRGKYHGAGGLAIAGLLLGLLGIFALFIILGISGFLLYMAFGVIIAGILMLLAAFIWAVVVSFDVKIEKSNM